MPSNRSFGDIVRGVRGPLASAPHLLQDRRPSFPDIAPFAPQIARPSTVVGAAVATIGLCVSTYCAIGFVHYKHVADIETGAAQRTERANADLQAALDRLRDSVAGAEVRIDETSARAPAAAASTQDQIKDTGQLTQALGPLDPQRTEVKLLAMAGAQADRPITLPAGHLQQTWARISRDQTEETLQRMAHEYEEVVFERDQLHQRVGDLEQKLSLLETREAPPDAGKIREDAADATSPRNGAASTAFPGSSGAEQSLKNFNTPGSVPNYFSNESGAILGTAASASDRRRQ